MGDKDRKIGLDDIIDRAGEEIDEALEEKTAKSLFDVIDYWDNNVLIDLNKLKFLSATCGSGVLGEDGILHRKDYNDASFGLHAILEDIIESLEKFYEYVDGSTEDQEGG